VGVSIRAAAIWRGRWGAEQPLKTDGRSSFELQPQVRVSQERALVNLEPPISWIDVHCSDVLTRTERNLDPGTDASVIYSHPWDLTPVDLLVVRPTDRSLEVSSCLSKVHHGDDPGPSV